MTYLMVGTCNPFESCAADAWSVMEKLYAAEAAYVAAGGFGEAN